MATSLQYSPDACFFEELRLPGAPLDASFRKSSSDDNQRFDASRSVAR
jgi:hypothetical protein